MTLILYLVWAVSTILHFKNALSPASANASGSSDLAEVFACFGILIFPVLLLLHGLNYMAGYIGRSWTWGSGVLSFIAFGYSIALVTFSRDITTVPWATFFAFLMCALAYSIRFKPQERQSGYDLIDDTNSELDDVSSPSHIYGTVFIFKDI